MRYPDEVAPEAELPFLNVHRYLTAAGVPVPAVYGPTRRRTSSFSRTRGIRCWRTRSATLGERVPAALRAVRRDPGPATRGDPRARRQGDPAAPLLRRREFSPRRSTSSSARRPGIRRNRVVRPGRADIGFFLPFLEQLSAFPRVLAHRDYHSRNVMVIGSAKSPGHRNLRVLDFQDARMGNVFYDLASLLRDSYVTLPEDAVGDLRYAWRQRRHRGASRRSGGPRRLRLAVRPGRASAQREGDRDLRQPGAQPREAGLPSVDPANVAPPAGGTSNGTRRCAPSRKAPPYPLGPGRKGGGGEPRRRR